MNGIVGLREFDPALFQQFTNPPAAAEPVTRVELEQEIRIKRARVRRFLLEQKVAGVLLSQLRAFSWITAGLADNHVVTTTETGASSLLITAHGRKFVLASNSEMPRLMAEKLRGLG